MAPSFDLARTAATTPAPRRMPSPLPAAGERERGSLVWRHTGWSTEVFVFLPAGAYAGNRLPALRLPYSPRLPAEEVRGVHTRPIITDVPRLNDGDGPSRLRLAAGDLAFPGFGFFDPRARCAWFVVAAAPASTAAWSFEIEESAGRDEALFRIRAGENSHACPAVRELDWPCADLAAFLDRIFDLTREIAEASPAMPASFSLSAAAALIEEHYHRDNWREDLGFFATDPNRDSPYHFQTGWCGGMLKTYPLLASDRPESAARAWKNWETFVTHAALPSGLFLGKCSADGRWMSDFAHDVARPHTHRWHLVRREGDALFYGLRQLALLEARSGPDAVPSAWWEALRRCADALARIWNRHGQFGQFIDQYDGTVLVGGSESGALIPAALVAAWRRWSSPDHLRVARAAGSAYAAALREKGYTTGGPGDACQNPDSESAASLVESFAALHAVDSDPAWLAHGRLAAALLATWTMPYDFAFPRGSEFSRLGIRTRGSVFANTQNKHSAPGLCTHSGAGLLHLFRVTGDMRLMDLLRDIARFLPQCVSRADRPIHAKDHRALPPGWMNERVNTSAWDDNVGGVFHGSCWCEVSLLLTALELPGVYARPDLGRVWCLDHVEARLAADGSLVVENPTAFPARVRLLVESHTDTASSLGDLWFLRAPMLDLAPGERRSLRF